jgi:hypothetical protein
VPHKLQQHKKLQTSNYIGNKTDGAGDDAEKSVIVICRV